MGNNNLREIGKKLEEAKTVLIYPHVNMDGDALGSAVAVCKALRMQGKRCFILIEDEIARNLQFLDRGYCTKDPDCIDRPDVSLCLDCGDLDRFLLRKEKFLTGKCSICIDHHRTTVPFCDLNYIDPEAAATGEIIFSLLQEIGCAPDREIGEALFAAITTDTGNFQYSNTTKACHEIAATLYDWEINAAAVSTEIYEQMRLEKLMLQTRALATMEIFCDGAAAIAYVDQQMLNDTGATKDEREGIVDQLRAIAGVQIAALLKEDAPEKIKVSFRAKSRGNVAEIAASFGGGGHIKAAGCTLHMPLKEARTAIVQKIEEALQS